MWLSTELLQPEHVLTAPASYPVDGITESQHCHLMAEWQNLKVKAAVGSVLPTEPGAPNESLILLPPGHRQPDLLST